MGALVEAEGNCGKGSQKSSTEKISASNPVVYQLVRVEVDGRLVPATDDELMEVEHLLQDDRKLQLVEFQTHSEQCPSNECLLPTTSKLEGLVQPEGMGVDPLKLDAGVEDETISCSPGDVIVRGNSADHPNHSQSCDDKLQPGGTLVETILSPTHLNGNCSAQIANLGSVSEPANDTVASRSPISETLTSSEPDFSILKGELCLDDLAIRELQEVFRVTFGRQTSVKDKLWLKRRITMGLTNSCEVPTASIIIKDNQVIQKNVKEEPSRAHQVISNTGSLPGNQIRGLIDANSGDSLNIHTNQIKNHQVLSSKRLRKPLLGFDAKNESILMEPCSNKRARKPTKRYIEELSDIETKESNGRSVSSVKDSGLYQVHLKAQVDPVCDFGSQGTTFVTRKDSIGGCGIQIPYVSRMRRGRPRKDFYALTNFGGMESNKKDTETSYGEEEQDLDHEKINPVGDTSSDNNGDTMHHTDKARKVKVGGKRKHHRAWTLCEVLKLVEGVARYGAGRWSEIRRVAFSSYSYRTSVDLKDKWRNLIRASFAQEPSDKGAKSFRKPTSVPIPTPILLRVRELAEMHSQAGIEFGPNKFSDHSAQIVHEKGSGFL